MEQQGTARAVARKNKILGAPFMTPRARRLLLVERLLVFVVVGGVFGVLAAMPAYAVAGGLVGGFIAGCRFAEPGIIFLFAIVAALTAQQWALIYGAACGALTFSLLQWILLIRDFRDKPPTCDFYNAMEFRAGFRGAWRGALLVSFLTASAGVLFGCYIKINYGWNTDLKGTIASTDWLIPACHISCAVGLFVGALLGGLGGERHWINRPLSVLRQ